MPTQQHILDALKSVKYPGYNRDIVSFGLIKNVSVNGGAVAVALQLTGGAADVAGQIKAAVEKAVRAVPGVTELNVEVASAPAPAMPGVAAGAGKVPGIKRVVA